jgi:hypothetical protein
MTASRMSSFAEPRPRLQPLILFSMHTQWDEADSRAAWLDGKSVMPPRGLSWECCSLQFAQPTVYHCY